MSDRGCTTVVEKGAGAGLRLVSHVGCLGQTYGNWHMELLARLVGEETSAHERQQAIASRAFKVSDHCRLRLSGSVRHVMAIK